MDKDKIFSIVQKYLEDVPVILVGTGATIPLGIPGMYDLSKHLIAALNEKYKASSAWEQVVNNLNDGIDLESALAGIILEQPLLDDIAVETWQLITKSDLQFFTNSRTGSKKLALAEIIDKYYQTQPQCVNIITTNYDRIIEYACDQIRVKVDTKYHGNYIRYFSNAPLKQRNVVNLLKVHGSLDLFRDENGLVYSIPLQNNIPTGFLPEIITPGISKYEAVLTSGFRNILHEADSVIKAAKSYLCIGYGFNDEQIQTLVIEGIKAGKPIVVVTKAISDKAASLLANNSNKFVIIEENPDAPNCTRFTINRDYHYLDETYWTIDGLIKIKWI